jgi:Sporulation protein family 7
LTSRRHFIGPIPEDWIHGHRKSWYQTRLSFKNYTSRDLTFSAKTTSFNEAPQVPSPNTDTGSTTWHEASADELPANATQRAPDRDHNVEDNEDVRTETGATAQSTVDTGASSAFVTARENYPPDSTSTSSAEPNPTSSGGHEYASGWFDTDYSQRQSSLTPSALPSTIGAGSTTSLLPNQHEIETRSNPSTNTLQPQEPQPHHVQDGNLGAGPQDRVRERIARLNFDDNVLNQQQRMRSRIERTQDKVSANRPRWSKEREGEMVRAQKMLVRVEETSQNLPSDYSENVSLRTETREVSKWREYVVVCRKTIDEDALFTLKMYKTRVIQDVDRSRKSAYYEIPLNKKSTKVNLYSSLDKTWALWHPQKHGTRIFILRPRSSSHAMEWYTFIRQTLGWHRPTSLLINVPDLNLSLIFKNPFEQTDLGCEGSRHEDQNPPGGSKEKLAANAVIENCISVLKSRSEWAQALEKWSKTSKMGLAWKRFDRLEWIHGSHEDEMYGTIAMQNSHDLELRPKHHYPSTIKLSDGEEEEEPAPIEGFLIRLTSQRGVQQRLGKSFSKRQYFFTQDRFLCFCKPSKAVPPHPPDTDIVETSIPSYQEIAKRNPLQYDIHPYQIQDGQIAWLSSGNAEFLRRHDEEAFAQFGRNIVNLKNSEGLIDLCQVNRVQPSGDSGIQDSAEGQNTIGTDHASEGNRFELVLMTGLVVRFKAYNNETRNEWIKRLTALVKYWKRRVVADAAELKAIRQHNLEILGIDERMESLFGQFASKWEVRRAEASPHLYNMCHMSGCRPIKVRRGKHCKMAIIVL